MKAFECRLCGTCCYGTGGITLEKGEIERISDFIGISSENFISDYCVEKYNKISITTGVDGYCIFFNHKKACLIHEVKPSVCSRWPFYQANINDRDTWDMAKYACPGINRDCTFEEFIEQSRE